MSTLTQKRYFENLDATRFLGFLHVFTAHCFFTSNEVISQSATYQFFQYNIRAGYLGLDYFFVLSSFLLTWIILEERAHTGKFKAIFFLIRRALRLWPSYLLIVILTYTIFYFLSNTGFSINKLPPIEVFLLFHANYHIIFHGQDFLYLLVFFWVISVEEQFYIFWAFAMKYLHRFFIPLIVAFILTSITFRYFYFDDSPNLWFNTLSILGNFGIGALAAWMMFYKNGFHHFIKNLKRKYIFIFYAIFIPVVYFYFNWAQSQWGIALEKIIFSFLFAFIILEQAFANKPSFALGKSKWINYLGRISLGLY
jgi:peptidoglycan/LPS O-acetylase OafA/YrhL